MLGWSEKPRRYVDPEDLYDQLDNVRGYLKELTHGASKMATKRAKQARSYTADTFDDAEELMKDNLAASMLIALGVGVAVGFFLRR
jgi:ElaB/YqjD/DUF883 family membrane-anchored ribosome-binding protein